jgi:hypothetical protein
MWKRLAGMTALGLFEVACSSHGGGKMSPSGPTGDAGGDVGIGEDADPDTSLGEDAGLDVGAHLGDDAAIERDAGGIRTDGSTDEGDAKNDGASGDYVMDGAVASFCGFTMPNPSSSGLPNPASYDTSADGVVADNITGLMWERSASASTFTQSQANEYCASEKTGGFSDWRVPTVVELVSLVDYSESSPSIDPVAFPGTPQLAYFWTSTPFAGNGSNAWVVYFYYGHTYYKSVANTYNVRCVRVGNAALSHCYSPGTRYQAQTDGTVLDAATRLLWQQTTSTQTLTWSAAKSYCAGLGGGFRPPSLTELQTIIDYTVGPPGPAIDLQAFGGTMAADYWTSSLASGSSDTAWFVYFDSGGSDFQDASIASPVRCVR